MRWKSCRIFFSLPDFVDLNFEFKIFFIFTSLVRNVANAPLFLYDFSKLGKLAILGKPFPIVSSAYCLGGVALKSLKLQYCDRTSIVGTVSTTIGKLVCHTIAKLVD